MIFCADPTIAKICIRLPPKRHSAIGVGVTLLRSCRASVEFLLTGDRCSSDIIQHRIISAMPPRTIAAAASSLFNCKTQQVNAMHLLTMRSLCPLPGPPSYRPGRHVDQVLDMSVLDDGFSADEEETEDTEACRSISCGASETTQSGERSAARGLAQRARGRLGRSRALTVDAFCRVT